MYIITSKKSIYYLIYFLLFIIVLYIIYKYFNNNVIKKTKENFYQALPPPIIKGYNGWALISNVKLVLLDTQGYVIAPDSDSTKASFSKINTYIPGSTILLHNGYPAGGFYNINGKYSYFQMGFSYGSKYSYNNLSFTPRIGLELSSKSYNGCSTIYGSQTPTKTIIGNQVLNSTIDIGIYEYTLTSSPSNKCNFDTLIPKISISPYATGLIPLTIDTELKIFSNQTPENMRLSILDTSFITFLKKKTYSILTKPEFNKGNNILNIIADQNNFSILPFDNFTLYSYIDPNKLPIKTFSDFSNIFLIPLVDKSNPSNPSGSKPNIDLSQSNISKIILPECANSSLNDPCRNVILTFAFTLSIMYQFLYMDPTSPDNSLSLIVKFNNANQDITNDSKFTNSFSNLSDILASLSGYTNTGQIANTLINNIGIIIRAMNNLTLINNVLVSSDSIKFFTDIKTLFTSGPLSSITSPSNNILKLVYNLQQTMPTPQKIYSYNDFYNTFHCDIPNNLSIDLAPKTPSTSTTTQPIYINECNDSIKWTIIYIILNQNNDIWGNLKVDDRTQLMKDVDNIETNLLNIDVIDQEKYPKNTYNLLSPNAKFYSGFKNESSYNTLYNLLVSPQQPTSNEINNYQQIMCVSMSITCTNPFMYSYDPNNSDCKPVKCDGDDCSVCSNGSSGDDASCNGLAAGIGVLSGCGGVTAFAVIAGFVTGASEMGMMATGVLSIVAAMVGVLSSLYVDQKC
jgi:hypothetical protein